MDAGRKAYADYSYHIMLLPDISSATVAQVKTGIAEGFPSFKIFTTNIRPTALSLAWWAWVSCRRSWSRWRRIMASWQSTSRMTTSSTCIRSSPRKPYRMAQHASCTQQYV